MFIPQSRSSPVPLALPRRVHKSKRLQTTQAQKQEISYAQAQMLETSYAQAQKQETSNQTELHRKLFES